MERMVAVYSNNTGVAETMSALLVGEGMNMIIVMEKTQLQDLLQAQTIQLLLLDMELDDNSLCDGIALI